MRATLLLAAIITSSTAICNYGVVAYIILPSSNTAFGNTPHSSLRISSVREAVKSEQGLSTNSGSKINNSENDVDEYAVNMNNVNSGRRSWASSLPLPENAIDEETANRARAAMEGPNPPALEGRCAVNLNFNILPSASGSASEGNSCSGVQWLHIDPPVLIVDDFLTEEECQNVLQLTSQQLPPDAGRVIRLESRVNSNGQASNRRSTTWYVRYGCKALAPLFHGLEGLLPTVRRNRIEEVQLVRYAGPGQGFAWHEDALDEKITTPSRGGQRVATVLVYLDDVVDETKEDGPGGSLSSLPSSGRTMFRDLVGPGGEYLAVAPRRGRALLFFPAITGRTELSDAASAADERSPGAPEGRKATFGETHSFDDTRPDHRTMHAGEPPAPGEERGGAKGPVSTKHIAQLWIHSSDHSPVVFGPGLNKHSDAQKHIDELRVQATTSN